LSGKREGEKRFHTGREKENVGGPSHIPPRGKREIYFSGAITDEGKRIGKRIRRHFD